MFAKTENPHSLSTLFIPIKSPYLGWHCLSIGQSVRQLASYLSLHMYMQMSPNVMLPDIRQMSEYMPEIALFLRRTSTA